MRPENGVAQPAQGAGENAGPAELETPAGIPVTPGAATAAERAALRVLQIGALAAVVVVSTNKTFELDRFFVPKELVLHLAALLAGLLALRSVGRLRFTRVDLFLLAVLALGGISALTARDPALAMRAMAISASGVAIFWAARAIREAGLQRPLLAALSVAVVLGCVTALLQAYGVRTDLFSINRAPGGTLGNRNFVAHLAAFGLPLVVVSALRAWRGAGYLLWSLAVMLVVGTLVLTRSRAGWLATFAVLLVLAAAMLFSAALRRHWRTWGRLFGIVGVAAAGVAGSLLLPNSLRWRSDSPYLETARAVTNYQEGSGRGRLVQYGRSLEMAVDFPVLGVGPGNWPLVYPDYAARGDPSLSRRNPGTTANPWPSSDWVAFLSERGLAAAALLGLVFLSLAAGGFRRVVGARDADEGIAAAALLALIAGTVVAGAFDAVLLLALPTLIVWAALGALWATPGPETGRRAWLRHAPRLALLLVLLVSAIGVYRSARQLLEIGI